MPNFAIGLSALQASQFAMDVVSSNLANANTPGYHRQTIHLGSIQTNFLRGGQQLGSGVQIQYIERVRSRVNETSLTNAISDTSGIEQQLTVERQLEAIFQPGEGSIHQRLDNFFGELNKLTSTPGEPAQRSVVLEQGSRLAEKFHQMTSQIFDLRNAVRYQLETEVSGLNEKLDTLASLTVEINTLSSTTTPNRELDNRDQLVNEIAAIMDISRQEHYGNGLGLSFAGSTIQQGSQPIEFHTFQTGDGQIGLSVSDDDRPVHLQSGSLPALLTLYNETIPEFEARLNELASEFIQQFDQIHATGVGIDGSFSVLTGSRPAESIDATLNEAGLSFPVERGDLYVSVIDSDGNRRTESVSIDPAGDTLQTVADKLTLIDNLHASVNEQTKQIQIVSEPGFEFDFSGALETRPTLTNFTGTSLPSFSGSYGEATSQTFRYEIQGTGNVGISDDLKVRVFDENNTLIGEHNIGNGYEAGTPFEITEGVNIHFSAGSVNDGDNFESELVANPDETGLLSALGLNSFFVGDSAATIAVDPDIVENPNRLASTRSGDIADTTNLFAMIELQDSRTMDEGRLSIFEFANEISTDLGTRVQGNTQLSLSLTTLQARFEQEQDSYAGVDLNEELVRLQQFQRSYEAALRVIQTADEMLSDLMNVLR